MNDPKGLAKETESNATSESKKPYHTPELIVHGTVERITANIGTNPLDSAHTGSVLLGP